MWPEQGLERLTPLLQGDVSVGIKSVSVFICSTYLSASILLAIFTFVTLGFV